MLEMVLNTDFELVTIHLATKADGTAERACYFGGGHKTQAEVPSAVKEKTLLL